jgi:hypothetical protein
MTKILVSPYSESAPNLRAIDFGNSKLQGEVELGIHALGYRYMKVEGSAPFSGLELIGAYPSLNLEYPLGKKISLSFTVSDETKYAVSRGKQPIFENKPSLEFALHPNSQCRFLKHFDALWFQRESVSNSGMTFKNERTNHIGVRIGL